MKKCSRNRGNLDLIGSQLEDDQHRSYLNNEWYKTAQNFIIHMHAHTHTFSHGQTSTHANTLTAPQIWTHAHPLLNTCCVRLSTLDWVFSWLNTWNWNYPNKLFWQLMQVFWSKPESLHSQCFHTESVPVTMILCLFFMLEHRFLLSLHWIWRDKNNR